MDGLTLLDRATVAGLRVELRGDDLVLTGPRSCCALAAEMGRRKAEVLDELRQRSAGVDPVDWTIIAAQRWGGADDSSSIDVPGQPEDLLPSRRGDPMSVGVPAGPTPFTSDDVPAWIDDPSLAVRTADVRASIESYHASLEAEARSPRLPGQETKRSAREARSSSVHRAVEPFLASSTDHPSDTLAEHRPCP